MLLDSILEYNYSNRTGHMSTLKTKYAALKLTITNYQITTTDRH